MSRSISLRLQFFTTLIAVCEERSFSKAAKRVGLSQGAVSQQIAILERKYGTKLLERGGEEIRVTPAGEVALMRAYEMLAAEKKLRQEVDNISVSVENTIRIAASTISGEHLLPAIIKEFRSIHPDANFVVSIVDSGEAWRRLRESEVDFAAVGTLIEDHKAYELAEIATEELVLIVPTDSVLASKNKVTIKEILKYPFVSREAGSGTRREVENMLSRAGINRSDINVVSELGSTEALINAVQHGIGISIVSSIAAVKAESNKFIKVLKISDFVATRRLFMARRKAYVTNRQRATDQTDAFWRFTSSRKPL